MSQTAPRGSPRTEGVQMKEGRDFQKARLYGAERDTFAWGQTIADDDLQMWLEKNVLSRAWFRKRWGNRYITVKRTHGGGRGGGGIIRLGRDARNEWVMLHELAHNLTHDGHGPAFAAVYVKLIHHVMGADAAKRLKAAYRVRKVKVSRKALPAADVTLTGLAPRPKVAPKPKKATHMSSIYTRAAVERKARKMGARVEFEPTLGWNKKPIKGDWSMRVHAPDGMKWKTDSDLVELGDNGSFLETYSYRESVYTGGERYFELLRIMDEGLEQA